MDSSFNDHRMMNMFSVVGISSAASHDAAERVKENLPIKVVVYRLFSVYFPSIFLNVLTKVHNGSLFYSMFSAFLISGSSSSASVEVERMVPSRSMRNMAPPPLPTPFSSQMRFSSFSSNSDGHG